MKINLPLGFAITMLISNQASAEQCQIIYQNNVELLVIDQSSSTIGGAFLGGIAALAIGATEKANSNSTEQGVKNKIDLIDTSIFLSKAYSNVLNIADKNKIGQEKCYFELKLTKNEIAYNAGYGIITMKFHVTHMKEGKIFREENKTLTRQTISPIPMQPKSKYKRGKNGGWIDVTPPKPTQEEGIESFSKSYQETISVLFEQLVKKIIPKS